MNSIATIIGIFRFHALIGPFFLYTTHILSCTLLLLTCRLWIGRASRNVLLGAWATMVGMVVMFLDDVENFKTARGNYCLRLCTLMLNLERSRRWWWLLESFILTTLSLLRLDYLEKEPLFLLHAFELFLCFIIHKLEFIFLSMGSDLRGTPSLHYCLNLLPIISEFIKRYKYIKISSIIIKAVTSFNHSSLLK